MARFPKVTQLKDIEALRSRLADLQVELPVDRRLRPGAQAPLAQALQVEDRTIGNRFTILPMEGWDATADGRPSSLVRRRWRRFGESGAKLIWGVEAVAVREDGRANPNQLLLDGETWPDIADARRELVEAHAQAGLSTDDLLVGLQLTHSGRFSQPQGTPAPRVAYRHPLLDQRVSLTEGALLSDAEIGSIAEAFVEGARLAHRAGFDFVDIKHCHGYLAHELLSAVDRPAPYGGDLEGRTRFLRTVVAEIRREVPELLVGVRLSAFDFVPFHPDRDGVGRPEQQGSYRHAFGGDGTGVGIDLTESHQVIEMLAHLGVRLLCITAGSPYYVPHIQRPALTPPSDGYVPPEDPLVGVARLLGAGREIAARHPHMVVVSSGLSYLQEWLPNVAQAAVAEGWTSSAGLGRMALSYPQLPRDVLEGRPLRRNRVCRTFSDCTTAPRNGMVSGCYPLDPHYKESPERQRLLELKRQRSRES